MASPKVDIKISVNGKQAADNLNTVTDSIDNLGKKGKLAGASLQNITNWLFSASLIKNIVSQIQSFTGSLASIADGFNLMQARLKLVTQSETEFAAAQQAVLNVARETRADIDGVSNLYIKLSRSLKSAGDETSNVADLTRTITQAMKVSGATTAETQATLLQLGQALASGTLRGEEFNSISEQGSRISQALADSLGVTIGELRALAQQGQLTTEVVVNAMKQQAETINAEFSALPLTISDSLQLVKNSWVELIGSFDDSTSTSSRIAQGIKLIADNLKELASAAVTAAKLLGVLYAAKTISSAINYVQTVRQTAAAQAIATKATQAQEKAEQLLAYAQAKRLAIQKGLSASTYDTIAANTRAAAASSAAAGKISASVGLLSKAGRFLLGLPGLLLYAAYEITGHFLNMDALLVSLGSGFKKLGAGAVLLFKTLAHPFDVSENLDEYRAKIRQIDDETSAAFDRIIEAENKKKNAYRETGEEQLTAAQKVKAAQDQHLSETQAAIDREIELRKAALAQQYTNQAEYEAQLQALETQSSALKTQAQLDYSNAQLGVIQQYYEQRDALKAASDLSLEQANQELTAKEVGAFAQSISRHLQYNQAIITAEQRKVTTIAGLNEQQAQSLKETSVQTLNALIKHAQTLAQRQKQAIDSNKAILADYQNFVNDINGDQRSGYQKLSDAQQQQRDIEAKLLEASRAQQAGNHEEAASQRQDAYDAAKALTQTYKDIASEADKGSLTQVQASGKMKSALELVKTAMDGVKESNDSIIQGSKDGLEVTNEQIDQYKNIIADLDAQLDKVRTVKIGVDVGSAKSAIADIDAQIKALNQTVTVNVKRSDSGADTQRASGGYISRKDKVPGTGSGDKIKALLEPGEFIMRKSAVEQYGASLLYAMNNGEAVARYQSGGLVTEDYLLKKLAEWRKHYNNPGGSNSINRLLVHNDAAYVIQAIHKLRSKFGNELSGAALQNADRFFTLMKRRIDRVKVGQGENPAPIRDALEMALLSDNKKTEQSLNFSEQLRANFMAGLGNGVLTGGKTGGGSSYARAGETVNLNLSMGNKQASATMPKTEATMALIDELKRHGAAFK